MNKVYKKKWLKALRSGKYRQTLQGCLVNKKTSINGKETITGYCCLGVLCDVTDTKQKRQESYLTKQSLSKFGFSDSIQRKLASMNDGGHYNFRRIADWISKNL